MLGPIPPTLPAMALPTAEYSPDELTELLSGLMPEIPGYRVLRLIGRGGMSYVYLGVQESLDRQVAIKVIRPDALKDEVGKLRFEKEARTIAKLQHPCIVGVHEVGRTEQGLLFYVMPYLSRGHVGQRDLSADDPRLIEVLRALLWALEYAHVRGVVHRDVKAENVLFDNADRPVLADFGIASSSRDRARITGSGFALGSSPHMAPEQARGERVDGRADLYSLGVLTFELLTGRLPFQHPDPLALALMHASDPVPRLPAGRQHWQPFVDRAMAKAPEARFADAQEMMAALDRVEARQRAAVASAAAWRRWLHPRWPRRSRLASPFLWSGVLAAVPRRVRAMMAGAAAVLLLALALFALPWPQRAAPPAMVATDRAEPAAWSGLIESPPAATAAGPARDAPGATAGPSPVDPDAVGSGANASPALALDPSPPTAAEAPAAEPEAAPGERELAAAAQQIARRRLSQPAGDNALESLRAARRALPDSAAVAALAERWLTAATPFASTARPDRDVVAARALFQHARALADEMQLRPGAAWTALEQAAAAPFRDRLRAGIAAADPAALRVARAEATAFGIDPALLEPYWSQPVMTARPGDRLRGSLSLELRRLPADGRPGLALMPAPVSRDDYAAFVADSGRAASACRVRTARVTLKRRSWQQPGFAQDGTMPVVCVSAADAAAYAAWRSGRDDVRYRLPTAAELQQATGASATPAAGYHAVREWRSDCGDGCSRQAGVGSGWRDFEARGAARGSSELDARDGYDDVGFRLAREVAAAELEQR
jgi:serine/threonine-protein kinase PpkA